MCVYSRDASIVSPCVCVCVWVCIVYIKIKLTTQLQALFLFVYYGARYAYDEKETVKHKNKQTNLKKKRDTRRRTTIPQIWPRRYFTNFIKYVRNTI